MFYFVGQAGPVAFKFSTKKTKQYSSVQFLTIQVIRVKCFYFVINFSFLFFVSWFNQKRFNPLVKFSEVQKDFFNKGLLLCKSVYL